MSDGALPLAENPHLLAWQTLVREARADVAADLAEEVALERARRAEPVCVRARAFARVRAWAWA